jgi:N-acetylglucosaminyldiphosphoundecaprenol N-acetyl-beta-D-mannosaminyltransferase
MQQHARLSQDPNVDAVGKHPASGWDDLSRDVYCVLGIPVDAVDMPTALRVIEAAAAARAPFLISTPNINFLAASQEDAEFRESLLLSEMCLADGMPVVWIARLMGLPIRNRVAGSDIFQALRANDRSRQLTLVLFGGAKGVGEAAAKALNEKAGGLRCKASICPEFASVEQLSRAQLIDEINASDADFLIAALGSWKGQVWLLRNHHRLKIPIRAHLGATINFAAGRVRRAPRALRKTGFEWLWRIKEEPHLWPRYWNDGTVLIRLLITRAAPITLQTRWGQLSGRWRQDLVIECAQDRDITTVSLYGPANARNVGKAISIFRDVLASKTKIRINLSNTRLIDPRFLGLLLMLRKQARKQNLDLKIFGASSRLRSMFRLNGADFLLVSD